VKKVAVGRKGCREKEEKKQNNEGEGEKSTFRTSPERDSAEAIQERLPLGKKGEKEVSEVGGGGKGDTKRGDQVEISNSEKSGEGKKAVRGKLF